MGEPRAQPSIRVHLEGNTLTAVTDPCPLPLRRGSCCILLFVLYIAIYTTRPSCVRAYVVECEHQMLFSASGCSVLCVSMHVRVHVCL